MILSRRIRTIYRKELIDILRDRRTLAAMILVPIVLYPLLLLGSVQAVSIQAESLEEEEVTFGVTSQNQAALLQEMIDADRSALADAAAETPPDAQRNEKDAPGKKVDRAMRPFLRDEVPRSAIDRYRIEVLSSKENLEHAIRERAIHAGVVFAADRLTDDISAQNPITLLADLEEVRSRYAHAQLGDLIERTRARIEERRLAQFGLPPSTVRPFSVSVVNLSSPPSILGQVLPLILILMTITGAIYPAIDLTAGERERGTLESLMVCPVPTMDLIVGKFLVVTTVAVMGAALNLASVSATVYFGGFNKIIATQGGAVPFAQMGLILLCLVPFAVLMSAIMIAVCAFARTFKEAQNYVTPVIIAVLLPGGIAAMPATRLDGIMLVMPVGNMVLLARELLIGASVSPWNIAMVVLSTSLYAAAGVAIAARVFGAEAVVFSDAASLRTLFSRRLFLPRERASTAMVLALVAVLFPTWFFVQSALSPQPDQPAESLLRGTAIAMPIIFVLLPLVILWFWKISVSGGFAIRPPAPRYLLAAVLIGVSAWIPSQEVYVLQQGILQIPPSALKSIAELYKAIRELTPVMAIGVLAVLPALCEELLFRGLFLGGLLTSARPRNAILVSAVVFAVFHFVLFRFAPTLFLGLVLGLLCWRSASVIPGMLLHLLHNGLTVGTLYWPWRAALGVPQDDTIGHLPPHVLVGGLIVFGLGVLLAAGPRRGAVLLSADAASPWPAQ